MSRLTTDKKTSEMTMTELALNSCYVKDGEAYYRDYSTDISTRDLIRNLYKNIDIEMPEDDEDFDESVFEDLQYGLNTDVGVIALLSRNLWAMAELREKLKRYEDAEEQGLVIKWIPFKLREMDEEEKEDYGEDAYMMLDCPLPDEDEEVLITHKRGFVATDTFLRDGIECYLDSNWELGEEAIAWASKPAAYKEAVSEEELCGD